MSATATPPREKTETRTKRQPPYAVVVLNDDDHTFNYVMIVFQKVFGYDTQKCFKLAEQIHLKGRAVVWTGALEVAELKKDQIQGMGPDPFASKVVNYPLGVDLEPLA